MVPYAVFAQDEYPTDPVAIGDQGSWVTQADWPEDLRQQGAQGRVAAELAVGADGLVKDCRIVSSSGHQQMDDIVCLRLVQRGLFEPARNVGGQAVDGIKVLTVVFTFDGARTRIPDPSSTVMELTIETDGTISECNFFEDGVPVQRSFMPCPEGREFEPPVDENGEPARMTIRVTTSVERALLPKSGSTPDRAMASAPKRRE